MSIHLSIGKTEIQKSWKDYKKWIIAVVVGVAFLGVSVFSSMKCYQAGYMDGFQKASEQIKPAKKKAKK